MPIQLPCCNHHKDNEQAGPGQICTCKGPSACMEGCDAGTFANAHCSRLEAMLEAHLQSDVGAAAGRP